MTSDVTVPQRWYAAVAAVLGWFALLLQMYVMVWMAEVNGTSVMAAVIHYFSYFTILTNDLVAVAFTVIALAPRSQAGRFFVRSDVASAVFAYIATVGLAYYVLLRHLWDPQGLQLFADRLLHSVIPMVVGVYWLSFVPKGMLRVRQLGWWAIYLVAYFLYVLAMGAGSGFYPYPFIDVTTLGYARTWENGGGRLGAFFVLSLIIVGVDRLLRGNVQMVQAEGQ